ncbi:hypothetical protein [Stieleria sp.]|uniref:hypothetical protein n=1 Tax=Stieleria sp. TaxID=2795976 RepID=UPI003565C16A
MTRYIIPAGTRCKIAPNDDNRPYTPHETTQDGEGELWPEASDESVLVIATDKWVYRVPKSKVRIEE